MRILFVSTILPIPTNNGRAMRSMSVLHGLWGVGHDLTFVSFAPRSRAANLEPLSRWCSQIDLLNMELPNLSEESNYFERIKSLLQAKSYTIQRFRSHAMRAKIQAHLSTGTVDLIVCDSLVSFVNVPKTSAPIALNCHNVEHVILKRYAEIEPNFARRLYARIEAALIRHAERDACRRATIAMACSEVDRIMLRELRASLPVFVVPNAVDGDSVQTADNHNEQDRLLLFQGGMDWYPNRDAVEFFAEQILPLVRAEYPGVRFVIAGRTPSQDLVERLDGKNGISFTGTVPNMAPYVAAATVVVAPLRLGSGTRIKILEACAAAKPVVATSLGAEGLELDNGKQIILADDPAKFAASVIGLLRDSAQRDEIGRSARRAVMERYSQAVVELKLNFALSSIAHNKLKSMASGPIETGL